MEDNYEDDYEDDYEDEENLSFGESFELILLEPYSGKEKGDVITVYRGVYNSLIGMHKALPMHCLDKVRASEKLVKNAEYLEDENNALLDQIADLFDQVRVLTVELDTYKQDANLKDKISKLEAKVKSYENNKPSAKKKAKKKITKKI